MKFYYAVRVWMEMEAFKYLLELFSVLLLCIEYGEIHFESHSAEYLRPRRIILTIPFIKWKRMRSEWRIKLSLNLLTFRLDGRISEKSNNCLKRKSWIETSNVHIYPGFGQLLCFTCCHHMHCHLTAPDSMRFFSTRHDTTSIVELDSLEFDPVLAIVFYFQT